VARPPFDPTLYFVTDPRLCAERGVLATVAAAVTGGVTAVQLRDPDAPARELHAAACALGDQLAGTGIPLIVNDRLDVALAADADGVHLGESDLPVLDARRLAGAHLLIGLSVTTASEAAAADRLPSGTVDYLGVGPVTATPTKPDHAPPIGVDGLRAACAATALPCVAIGGISPDNAMAVAGAGAAGIAVVSAIAGSDDPAAAASDLRRRFESGRATTP
jgi:thiamine-phosphate pyrophosphorylase